MGICSRARWPFLHLLRRNICSAPLPQPTVLRKKLRRRRAAGGRAEARGSGGWGWLRGRFPESWAISGALGHSVGFTFESGHLKAVTFLGAGASPCFLSQSLSNRVSHSPHPLAPHDPARAGWRECRPFWESTCPQHPPRTARSSRAAQASEKAAASQPPLGWGRDCGWALQAPLWPALQFQRSAEAQRPSSGGGMAGWPSARGPRLPPWVWPALASDR